MELEWLPAGAVKIEYLQNAEASTQWIYLGNYNINGKLEVEAKFQITDSISGERDFFGDGITFFLCGIYQSKIYHQSSGGVNYGPNAVIGDTYQIKIIRSITENKFIVNGIEYTNTNTGQRTSLNLSIFGASKSDNSGVIYPGTSKIYYLNVRDNDNLILSVVPIRIGQTGYLFDKISKQTFGISGTGSLLLGPDL